MSSLGDADSRAVTKILEIESNSEECRRMKDDTVWPAVKFKDIATNFVLSLANNFTHTENDASILQCYPVDPSYFSVIEVLFDFGAVFGPVEVLQSSGGGYYVRWTSENTGVTLTLTFGDGRRTKDSLGMVFIYRETSK